MVWKEKKPQRVAPPRGFSFNESRRFLFLPFGVSIISEWPGKCKLVLILIMLGRLASLALYLFDFVALYLYTSISLYFFSVFPPCRYYAFTFLPPCRVSILPLFLFASTSLCFCELLTVDRSAKGIQRIRVWVVLARSYSFLQRREVDISLVLIYIHGINLLLVQRN